MPLAALPQEAVTRSTPSSGRIPAFAAKRPVPDFVGGFRIFSPLPSSVLGRSYSAAKDGSATVELRLLERDDASLNERVKLAVNALSRIEHPNLARVVAQGEDQGFTFYALAVPECATLLDLVRRGRPLDGAEVAWVGAGLASALAALHERGLAHGDVTPVNVGIGKDGTPTLVDLGWAPRVRDPEFGLKLPDATAQDVSQLGATLIFATTGQAVKPRATGKSGRDTTASGKKLIEKATWLTPVICEILDALQGEPATRPSAAEAARRFQLAGEDTGLKKWGPPPDFVEAAQNLLANRTAGSDKTTASTQTGIAGAPALGAFGRYVLLEEVARGGMGVVYRARHAELDRFFALKVLLSGDLASDVTRRRFLREAEAAAQLDHPSIVRVHDFGEHDGRAYIAMDFASGKSLSHMLPDPKVKLEKLLELFARVADAVHYAHSRGIIHRDLKPQNIVVDEDEVPRILDFGVAKRLDEEARPGKAGAGLTTEGELVGTPAYMPPEQA
ncbi:protein kinase, partial [bacterium]|nr:protein kinase [bacterium]